jgi:hypothetical protein
MWIILGNNNLTIGMVVVELILIRHGYACSNATKSIAKSISKNGELPQRLYQDPELTSDGIALCKARRAETITFGWLYKWTK